MILINKKPKELEKLFLRKYGELFPNIDLDYAKELIKEVKKDYTNAKYQNLLEKRWYKDTDFTVYDDDYYFTDLWFCFLEYSRKYLKSLIKYKEIVRNPSSILDLGCGIGYTTAFLKQIFPEAKVYGSNIANTKQFKFCQAISKKYNFEVVSDIYQFGRVDLIFASEYFEHIEKPLEHLEIITYKLSPKVLVLANSFNTKSVGHFLVYKDREDSISQKKMSRMFNECLRGLGYKRVKAGFWNNRPAVWSKV